MQSNVQLFKNVSYLAVLTNSVIFLWHTPYKPPKAVHVLPCVIGTCQHFLQKVLQSRKMGSLKRTLPLPMCQGYKVLKLLLNTGLVKPALLHLVSL